MKTTTPIVKHLVLVGGGHSHLAVLRRLGMRPVPGLAVTLITRDVVTPYSGCLPGFLAGTYSHEQMHIDLNPLAQFAAVRLIQAEVCEIDLESKSIALRDRPAILFDSLSINTGSVPDGSLIPGAAQHAIGIKPIDKLLKRWQTVSEQALERLRQQQAYHLAIIGGGPASVEFALAAQSRINKELGLSAEQPSVLHISLLSANKSLLLGHNDKVRRCAEQELSRRGIEVMLNHEVSKIEAGVIHCGTDTSITADAIVYATGASLPAWLKSTGLRLSTDGFIEVTNTLQSSSHDFVFAAGDAATIAGAPRPKSGVYAVRQGKVLAENLIAYARGKHLRHYHPQHRALALMSLSNGKAIASRGGLFYHGKLAWRLKHRIDSAFLRKYSRLPDMATEFELSSGLVDKATEQRLRKHALRCAGCGAKVASAILKEVLTELPQQPDSLTRSEDAACIELGDGRQFLQSVDLLKAFHSDPWLFARIASNHCLSDLHAMGVTANSAQAIVGLPPASSAISKAQLGELMQGCNLELQAEGCELIGGHSAESDSLQFGLCVNAIVPAGQALLHKTGMQAGDVLILTKALGTGTVLAAQMRYQARHGWIQACLDSMLQSNRAAVQILLESRASSCTDITGFGLVGHLAEMLDSCCQLNLELQQINALPGALECFDQGITSSLHEANSLTSEIIEFGKNQLSDPQVQLLFDPQTAGGLLASIPAANSETCLKALHKAGYKQAAIIGQVLVTDADAPLINLC